MTDASILDTDIQYLKGVGPRRAEALATVKVHTFRDLLRYYPRRYLDRTTVTPIRQLHENGEAVTVAGTISSEGLVGRGRKKRFEVRLQDESGGTMSGVWFRATGWVSRVFKQGQSVAFHGKVSRYGDRYSMSHPDFDLLDSDGPTLDTGRIIALYPGSSALEKAGLTSRSFRRLLYGFFRQHGLELEEILPEWMIERYHLLDGRVALRAIHLPRSIRERSRAERRLKFEELFFIQLLLAQTRQKRQVFDGPVFEQKREYMRRFMEEVLPFQFTGAQRRALATIQSDTGAGRQMNRLIQGDVGSGKTVVAIAALLLALDNGYQGAFMAPTEILAEQHYAVLKKYLDPLGIEIRLLVGAQRKALRDELLAEIAEGRAQIVVGTHAIFQDAVAFRRLGLAVVDEQHRFGVTERARMFDKGERPHMLLMTATPIPRSLAMTLYGDLEVTTIDEMPAGRRPIETRMYHEKQRDEMYAFIKEQLREGRQAYVVYPLVEESEKLDLRDAENGYEKLKSRFRPYTVDLVHGQLFSYEKEEAMDRFKDGATDLLVATTVIEVGVDVSNATVMVIEHAERFGLSQLHQLRGRVGRGEDQSYCLLMAGYKRSAEAEKRLETMLRTSDGFEISETDLRLRGAGDFFGTRQSGLPDLKIADITQDQDILREAREAALQLAERDPDMLAQDHETLRRHYSSYYARRKLGYARVG